jgi:GH18 family chitinase
MNAAGYGHLSIAVAANPAVLQDVNSKSPNYWQNIANLGVNLDLMTYDYNGQAWSVCTTTQFNSPLFSDPANQCNDAKNLDINDSVEALSNLGVPTNQIVVGVPTYGRAYSINNTQGITSPYITYTQSPASVYNYAVPSYVDVWTNREILTGRAYGATSTPENTRWSSLTEYSPVSQSYAVAYVNWANPAFISFTSFADAQNVMKYAIANGSRTTPLAGVMVWELDQDVQPGDTDNDGQPLNIATTSVVSGLASALPSK